MEGVASNRNIEITHSALLGDRCNNAQFLLDNVWHPFVNGSGLIRLSETLLDKDIGDFKLASTKPLSSEWTIQFLSALAGSASAFVVAGKATGLALRTAGRAAELRGFSARLISSDNLAQIAGAGIYTFAQKPQKDQTRSGEAVGSMVGMTAFATGNKLLAKYSFQQSSRLVELASLSAGRLAVGALGGLGAFESKTFVNSQFGLKRADNSTEASQAMFTAASLNAVMPVFGGIAENTIDYSFRSRPWGNGISIGRELEIGKYNVPELEALAAGNPLARVKRVDAKANADANVEVAAQARIRENTIFINTNIDKSKIAPLLAHELTHLRIARIADSSFARIANAIKATPQEAERDFYALRNKTELEALEVERIVQSRLSGKPAELRPAQRETGEFKKVSADMLHSELWKADWEAFKKNASYRPNLEYAVRVYGSPWGFGNRKTFTHLFAWATESKEGAGRSGMFGKDFGIGGYPKDFEPSNPVYDKWSYTTVESHSDGTYGAKHLSETEFIKALSKAENKLNGGLFFPFLNDCYVGLERAFRTLGQKYPGAPAPRIRITK